VTDSIHTDTYKDWQIIVRVTLPTNEQYRFVVEPPDRQEALEDKQGYATLDDAIGAAKGLVDRRIARDDLGSLLDDLVEKGQIDSEAHAKILTALAESAKPASSRLH
jgi:hypothetical protein